MENTETQEKQQLILTIQNLESGELSGLIPEFYELKDSIENSEDEWHQQESVFDHTLTVMKALEKMFADNEKLKNYFDEKIDNYSRRELLNIAAAFHDIGKKESMTKNGKFTKCTGHEKIGVKKTKTILERFNLSPKETDLVLDIISNHSAFHYLLNPGNPNFQKDLDDLHNRFDKSIYQELIALSYADTVNSKLKIARPDEFNNRINFYQKELETLQ